MCSVLLQPCALSTQKLVMEMYAKCLCQGCVSYLYGVNEEIHGNQMEGRSGRSSPFSLSTHLWEELVIS